MNAAEHPDAQLVSASRAGDRSAFGQIVTRYQSLVCSVAYSGSGSLSLSEDVAQETFVAAWKQLEELREPEKLRAWLCGIARNVTRNTLRRLGREPVQSAESIEAAHELPALEKQPADHTMSREEEAILWRSLERIPDTYREPLVLFYREGQSVEQTAALLELSEDAVKQRLSRGRKLLAEEVAGFVEGALKSSAPGRAFTLGVLASLPILTTSAKAATLGAVAAKGSATAKAAAAAGVFNALLGAVLGFLGPWIQYRMFLDSAKSDRQREIIRAFYHKLFGCMLVFSVALVALIFVGRSFVSAHPLLYAGALICLVTTYVIAGIRLVIWANRHFRELRAELATQKADAPTQPVWEYRSRLELLGLPLVHVRVNSSGAKHSPVKAWIAVGDCAYGLLFAFGGLAVAPVSIGGLAIGLMPWGGAAVGLFALGGIAIGGWTFGGIALGWQAFGGCALAWNAAMGGLALAHDFALGGLAHAAQANTEVASQVIKANTFFANMEIVSRYIGWLNLLWFIPLVYWWRKVAKHTK